MITVVIEYDSIVELVDNNHVINQRVIETLKAVLRSEIPFSRKPGNWDDVNGGDYNLLNDSLNENLSLDLSILPSYPQDFVYGDDWDNFTPFDDISDRFREEMIFLIQMNNGRLFLINTEGFGYCRYVFELINPPPLIKAIN